MNYLDLYYGNVTRLFTLMQTYIRAYYRIYKALGFILALI